MSTKNDTPLPLFATDRRGFTVKTGLIAGRAAHEKRAKSPS